MKSWKKGLSLCLALLMCFSLLPAAAFAEEAEEADIVPVAETEAAFEATAEPAVQAEADDDGEPASGLQVYGGGDVWVSAGDAVRLQVVPHTNEDYNGGLTYEWGHLAWNESGESVFTPIEGAADVSYEEPEMTEAMHHEEYRCVVTDAYGFSESADFRLLLDSGLVVSANEDSLMPWADVTFIPGETLTLTARAIINTSLQNTALSYQWYISEDDEQRPIDGETGPSLVLDDLSESTVFTCVVTDYFGKTRSASFNVSVDSEFAGSFWLKVKGKNSNTEEFSVPFGGTFQMEVEPEYYNGYEGTELTYQWYLDGEEIEEATEPVFVSGPVTSRMEFSCDAYDAANDYTDTAYITLTADTGLYAYAADGDTFGVAPGGSAVLTVAAGANDGFDVYYQWYNNYDEEIEGANGNTLIVNDISSREDYTCRVSDAYGNELEVDFWVYVDTGLHAEAVGSTSISVEAGTAVTLEVSAGANEGFEITYQWRDTYGDVIDGEDGPTLTVQDITQRAWYSCDVGDGYGNYIQVKFCVYPENHLTVTRISPEEFFVPYGSEATVRARVTADDTEGMTLIWYFGGSEHEQEFTEEPSYTIPSVGMYCELELEATDKYGNSDHVYFAVGVENGFWAEAAEPDVTVPAGESATLQVRAGANTGDLTYTWFRHEGTMGEAGWFFEQYGEASDTFVTPAVTELSHYFCNVEDCYGTVMTVAFTVRPGEAPQPASIHIKDFSCPEDGQTLTVGDTVHFTVRVDGETAPTRVYVVFSDLNYQNYKTADAVLNESTGLWEAEYTFTAEDVFGVYQVSGVYADSDTDTAGLNRLGVLFLYAEDGSAVFNRLKPATDLHWTSDGYGVFTLPDDHQGTADIRYFSESGEEVDACSYPGLYSGSVLSKEFVLFASDTAADGKYYFTVQMRGDGVNYFDSPIARSEYFEYVAPEAKLPTVTDLRWTYNEWNGWSGEFSLPEDTAWLGGYIYEWFHSSTEDGTPESCNTTSIDTCEPGDTAGMVVIWDSILQEYGAGYYYYRVKLITGSVLDCRNGDWSELSPGYDISNVPKDVYTQLEEIDVENLGPEEIREAVQEIPTGELLTAMLTDSAVVDEIRLLEEAAGAPTLVDSAIPELSGATAVGAGLNDTTDEGPVTLVIGEPEWDDVLPAMYDNTLALRFSMDLDNVADTENLKVPVMVDLPVPYSIDPNFLVLLHYHAAGGEPEFISPYIYWNADAGQYFAQFILTSFSDFVMTQRILTADPAAQNNYLLLVEGESATPQLFGWTDTVSSASFRVTDENGKPFESEDAAVIEVTDPITGEILALRPGTAYLVADIERIVDYEYYVTGYDEDGRPQVESRPICRMETIRCRVDVIPAKDKDGEELDAPVAAAVTKATLRDSKATVELFRTDYTTVTVLLEMDRLLEAQALVPEWELPELEDQGVSIESAKFIGEGSELFALKVVDDRTLAIVPEYSTLELALAKSTNVKKSYKLGISLVLSDGTGLTVQKADGTNAVLALTVKQSKPSLKAGALKFNSVMVEDTHAFSFKGGVVTALEPDLEAAEKAGKEAVPSWIEYFERAAWLTDEAPAKASGKLYLLATLDGWALKKSVTVSYSVAPTAPKLSFKPASLTLSRSSRTYAYTIATLKPGTFAENGDFHYDVKIREGDVEYEVGTVLDVDVRTQNWSEKQSKLRFGVACGPEIDTGAHTYKVLVTLCNARTNAPVSNTAVFTVKVGAEDRTLKLTQYGSIEALAGRGSIELDLSFKNFGGYSSVALDTFDYELRYVPKGSKAEQIIEKKADGSYEWFDVFTFWGPAGVYFAPKPSAVPPKGTYYAYVTAHFSDGKDSNPAKIKLNLKWTDPAKVKPVTIKGADTFGAVDPIREGSAFVLRLKGSDKYYYSPECFDDVTGEWTLDGTYEVIETVGKAKTTLTGDAIPFTVTEDNWLYKNSYRWGYGVQLKPGAAVRPGASYSIRFDFRNIDELGSWSAEIKIPVKMGAVKLQALPQVSLLTSDRFSNGEFVIAPKDTSVRPVSKITLDSKSAGLFEVHEVGNGRWAIGYKDNVIPASLKAGATKTVKLSVFFEGNVTAKANVTVSLKVKLK